MSSLISLSKAEKSYIQSSLLCTPPLRTDGRNLHQFRPIALETGVVPLANGSAHVVIGGGTTVIAAVKLQVEDIGGATAKEHGRIVCAVSCSPAAYPHLSQTALDDLQYDATSLINSILSHPSLYPSNLGILPGRKEWALTLDLVVLIDSGNLYDALFMAAHAALWDTRVPLTRSVTYKGRKGGLRREVGNDSVEQELHSGFDTRQLQSVTDFELPDYWDEGEVLSGRDQWPVCVTLNLHPPAYYVDATLTEEAATPLHLLLLCNFPSGSKEPCIQGMRMLGPAELTLMQLKELMEAGKTHARTLGEALTSKLRTDDVRRGRGV